jgi:CRISPR/Cas system CMR-associated protein Cmr1 (group 7 of RAMP superfamily)
MKKLLFCFSLILITFSNYSQTENLKSSIDFVSILNNNQAEILYYYQNNWKSLREAALKKSYIASYNLIEITPSEATPYNFILITTYANATQYENREAHFEELIKASGGLKLLNDKEPKDFRKIVHGQDPVNHW